jgi:hypothetical protein
MFATKHEGLAKGFSKTCECYIISDQEITTAERNFKF